MSGRQALVRLLLAQAEADTGSGLRTAGFVSGYRGSPLGGFDAELWKAAELLNTRNIVFQPGLNEDLAMTAVAGTQQVAFLPGPRFDGVFALWYGKGPGVDRSGDAIKHANLAGVSRNGGVLLVFGDDHAGKSSTTAHQSDLTLASWEVPILYPSNVAEVLAFGLAGFAMSRASGALIALKLVNETAEGTGVVDIGDLPAITSPDRASDVHIRPETRAMQAQDKRLLRDKLPLAQAFARANRLDRIAYGADTPTFLIATAGKAYADVLAALELLGLTDALARQAGIGVYKIGLIFPLDPEGLKDASRAAREIFFVEEKRAHAEGQAKAIFYNETRRPLVTGKYDDKGAALLPADLPLDIVTVATRIADRLEANLPDIFVGRPDLAAARAAVRERYEQGDAADIPVAVRRPGFCPGCPHNTSTKVPDGSFGATGIGCHGMVVFHPERKPLPMGHMGAEGAQWIGLAPFTETPHIFQNLGDGTYSHSGSLAIRAAVAAGTTLTYKILYNDAVAMTGGQPVEGALTVARIARQVAAEGVARIVVVSDDPGRFSTDEPLPAGTELRHRDELALVQDALRLQPGVSILIFDQVCAAEKRRRRKIGTFPDPDRRVVINPAVCEGCGDCSTQSNCMAIQPLETELGRKRRIDQSACNKDFSCLKGFCPSFVMLEGAMPRRRPAPPAAIGPDLPLPEPRPLGKGFDMILSGIGGTGVVTVAAILGMAARVEGFGASLYDMTGLSQKGGAVFSHVRLRPSSGDVVPARLGPQEADLVLACDLVAGVHPEVTGTIAKGRTWVVANSDLAATADFQVDRDASLSLPSLTRRLEDATGQPPALLAATGLAERLLGDSIAGNILLLGFAWQSGRIPLRLEAIEQAIRLNGRGVDANLRAFAAGREAAIGDASVPQDRDPTLAEFVDRRATDLSAYWNVHYAARYTRLMETVRAAAAGVDGGEAFAWAVARSAYKLMAYKDEYEVARLYSDGRFHAQLERDFENLRSLRIMLSPPLLARIDPATGRPRKIGVGRWIFPLFRGLAACRGLREGPFDIFGRAHERRVERALRDAFLDWAEREAANLSPASLAQAVALAEAPLQVRGFGLVKLPAAEALLERLRGR